MSAQTPYKMNEQFTARLILAASYASSFGVWITSAHLVYKLILAVFAGATTAMAFMNQYKTFEKNYRTLWIVIRINNVFTFLKPKKTRHRRVNASQKKKQSDGVE